MSGVPQGIVVAPLLFLCYINDLPENVSSKVRLYADDVLIHNTIHSKEDCLMLQEDINSLQLWANKWPGPEPMVRPVRFWPDHFLLGRTPSINS